MCVRVLKQHLNSPKYFGCNSRQMFQWKGSNIPSENLTSLHYSFLLLIMSGILPLMITFVGFFLFFFTGRRVFTRNLKCAFSAWNVKEQIPRCFATSTRWTVQATVLYIKQHYTSEHLNTSKPWHLNIDFLFQTNSDFSPHEVLFPVSRTCSRNSNHCNVFIIVDRYFVASLRNLSNRC